MGVLYFSFERYINDIEMYLEEHCPGIELELVSFQPPQLEKALEHGEVDIAVTLSYDDAPIAGYDKRIFAREGLSAAVSTEHPLAERESISLTDLSGETIVLMRDEPDYNAAVMKLLAANGVEPAAYCYASQVDTTFQEIRKRNGITLFPVQMDYLKKRGVSFVDVEDAGEKIRMAVIFKDSGQTALARTAADAICEMYS